MFLLILMPQISAPRIVPKIPARRASTTVVKSPDRYIFHLPSLMKFTVKPSEILFKKTDALETFTISGSVFTAMYI